MNARPAELEKLSQGQADSRTVHRDSPGGETDLEQSKDTLTDKSAENPRTQTQKETRHQHPGCLPFQLQQQKAWVPGVLWVECSAPPLGGCRPYKQTEEPQFPPWPS